MNRNRAISPWVSNISNGETHVLVDLPETFNPLLVLDVHTHKLYDGRNGRRCSDRWMLETDA